MMHAAPQVTVGMGWRAFFWAACAYNLVIGALGLLAPDASTDGRIIGLLVLCFGIVYLLVARDPLRFAPVLWAGLIGKFGVVGLLGPGAFAQGGDPMIAAILVGDALFAIGFLVFLLTHRTRT